MAILILGLVLFLSVHSLRFVAPARRAHLIATFGEAKWQGIAGMVALLGFMLILWGYGQARLLPMPLYAPPTWTRHLSLLIMVPVFPLFIATYLPGRLQSAVVHPTLTAVILWALAHLIANGNLADLILFGAFLAWALADRISLIDRPMPPIPGAAPHPANDLIAIGTGLLLYGVFLFWVHTWLFGVSPLGVTVQLAP